MTRDRLDAILRRMNALFHLQAAGEAFLGRQHPATVWAREEAEIARREIRTLSTLGDQFVGEPAGWSEGLEARG
jgi:hypothetical protein